MICPECGKATYVFVTKASGTTVKRRRECLNGHRFNTFELTGDIKEIKRKLLLEIAEGLK